MPAPREQLAHSRIFTQGAPSEGESGGRETVFDRLVQLEHVATRGNGAYLETERRDLTAQPTEVNPQGGVDGSLSGQARP